MIKKGLLLLLATSLFIGCSTVRLQYKADVTTEDGRRAVYDLKKSYDVGGAHKTLCIVTGVFLGGSCWFYLAMPTAQQEDQISQDAQVRLAKTFPKGKYSIEKKNVDVVNWQDQEEDSTIVYKDGQVSAPKEKHN